MGCDICLLSSSFVPHSFRHSAFPLPSLTSPVHTLLPSVIRLLIMAIAASKPKPTPDHFVLPDLVSHCNFPLAYHPHGDDVAAESVKWLDDGCPELSPRGRKALYGLQAGELTAYCYPYCSTERLRVVSDFMNYLFHLDNISDGMMRKGTEELADSVMNALWFPDRYMPTACDGKEQPVDETSAGKLAREYVILHRRSVIRDADDGHMSSLAVTGRGARGMQSPARRHALRRAWSSSSKPSTSRPEIAIPNLSRT